MLRILLPVIALCAVLAASANGASTAQQQLHAAQTTVVFFQNHNWLRAPRQENCLAVPWTGSCQIARRVFARDFRTVLKIQKLEQQYSIPWTNDWRTAVRLTQRVFPGTDGWLLYISDREGGYGPFVMNHQGSGAGGWMQFMASTFYAYYDDARAAVQARGFKVDPSVWDWHHPLGQALTAGYMRYTGRDGCHWCL